MYGTWHLLKRSFLTWLNSALLYSVELLSTEGILASLVKDPLGRCNSSQVITLFSTSKILKLELLDAGFLWEIDLPYWLCNESPLNKNNLVALRACLVLFWGNWLLSKSIPNVFSRNGLEDKGDTGPDSAKLKGVGKSTPHILKRKIPST